MSGARITVSVDVSGPFADGTAKDILNEYKDEVKKRIADYAVGQLRAVHMDKTGRATGHYQAEIEQKLIGYNDVLIRDPVVYGPWLEGVSKRNRKTRFKGYRLWRRAKSATEQEKVRLAEDALPPFLARLGGRP